ncbi:hypothetical protein BZG36_02010 [Bifiguratus adelaidae]|uniref:Autophagy-related protein n=1 Tax=Bifiguratus adelaidae TaxID=1938954 RepID=A0A261Y489_9FUNG|nr:hypothetical protein BZG36_02010 [Bifiguratus adelaidae]
MAACTICYLAVTKPIHYNAIAVLQIFALTFNATATIFWYSYMSILTRYHPMVVAARDSEMPEEEYANVVEIISNGISAYGFVIGYLCRIITLILGLVYLMLAGSPLYKRYLDLCFLNHPIVAAQDSSRPSHDNCFKSAYDAHQLDSLTEE